MMTDDDILFEAQGRNYMFFFSPFSLLKGGNGGML
jgi:hypothetical protein